MTQSTKPKREDYDNVMDYYKAFKAWSEARAKKHGDMKYTPEKTWEKIEKFATKFVRDVRRRANSDEAIMKEVDPGYKKTPKKRKKRR